MMLYSECIHSIASLMCNNDWCASHYQHDDDGGADFDSSLYSFIFDTNTLLLCNLVVSLLRLTNTSIRNVKVLKQ